MSEIQEIAKKVEGGLTQYKDFPQPGVLYEDILPIFRDASLIKLLARAFRLQLTEKVDYVVGLEAKGFLLGVALALEMNCGFVPIRKKGKLPGECASAAYVKEYGADTFEVQKDSLPPGSRVVIVDDVLATGGSALAAAKCVTECGAEIVQFQFVMEIESLGGARRLSATTFSLLKR